MSVNIESTGIKSLQETLANMADGSELNLDDIAEQLAIVGQETAKELAPVRTGYLRDNIVVIKITDGQYLVLSQAPYSLFQEFGFQHYRDGFIPGKFFMTQGMQAVMDEGEDLLEQQLIQIALVAQVDPVPDT